jgi:DNA polymerase-3 subunit beta
MKFRVAREVLADAVAWTARSLPPRPSVPVLAGILLEVDASQLSVSGFDYEVSARAEVDVAADESGRVLVPGRLLAEITRALPPHPVEISADGPRLAITCGNARFSLPTLPVEDYPSLPAMPSSAGVVDSDVFAEAVGQVAVAAGRDDTLPMLTGVRLEIDDDRITLAATDRYRLAVREFLWKPEQPGLSSVALVPAKTLNDTAKALTGGESVQIALSGDKVGEGMIGFEGAGRRTTTRLLEGEFPKYRALFPAESATVATVETQPFVDAVKRVSLVAERNTPVRLTFTDGRLVLEAGSGDEAQASEAIEAGLQGDEISIAFNPTFLLDGLSAIDAPVAQLSFTTATKPAVMTGKPDVEAQATDEYRYLLMPVRLSG